jgi:hypothetical protein
MVDVAAVWKEALPKIRESVSGVGVWAALNTAIPIAYENGEFVIGLPAEEGQLAGHLRVAQTRRTLDVLVSRALESQATVRIITGVSERDWEMEKRRDDERRRLQEAALNRERARQKSTSSWEDLYVQLGRSFSQIQNRTLPQNRAQYLIDSTNLLAAALAETPVTDDASERSYARCIERVAQHADVPSTFVAMRVLDKAFGG